MGNLKKRVHSIQALVAFVLPFLLIFPLFALFLQRRAWFGYAFRIHHWWSRAFFTLSGLKFSIEYRKELDPERTYVFCPNHFSFLDIPTTVRNKHLFTFMGKDDMKSIPLFGYMYRKMHILLDRESIKSSYKAMMEAGKVLDEGRSILVFPEGGILTRNPPRMVRFKDGAFRLAIEKQVPIVPVTIPYNWIILPDDGKFLIEKRTHKVLAIFHEPIETNDLTLDAMDDLKNRTFNVIDRELRLYNKEYGNN